MPSYSLADAVAALNRRAATGRRELPAGFEIRAAYPAAEQVTVVGRCAVLDTEYAVTVRRADLEAWQAMQVYAEDAFPILSEGDREFLISGFSPAGWDKMFPPEDDE